MALGLHVGVGMRHLALALSASVAVSGCVDPANEEVLGEETDPGGKGDCASAACSEDEAIGDGLDLDGDGFKDLIISATSSPSDDVTSGWSDGVPDHHSAGRVYLLPGRGDLTFGTPVQLAVGEVNMHMLGEHLAFDPINQAVLASDQVLYVARFPETPLIRHHTRTNVQPIGDLDRDGRVERLVAGVRPDHIVNLDDLAVTIETDLGASITEYQRIPAPSGVSHWGLLASAGGDFDGDGRREILISGYHGDVRDSYKPHGLYVFERWGREMRTTPSKVLPGAVNSAEGWSPSIAVLDFDGDGYDDLITAPWRNLPAPEVRVYRGGPAGLSTTPEHLAISFSEMVGSDEGTQIGVESLGDIDGDGDEDLAVIGPQHRDGALRGAVAILHGGSSALTTPVVQTLFYPHVTQTNWDAFGASVSAATDFDDDGYRDLVIGAPIARSGLGSSGAAIPGQGEAFVYRGSASGFASTPTTTLESPAPYGGWMYGYGSFGRAVLP